MKTHICIGCNKAKPLSDYYVYPNGHHYTRCIKCQKAYTHAITRNGSIPHEHELRCLGYLHSFGIPVMEGKHIKHPDYKYIDLVAFGIIRIEVKRAQPGNRIWFSHRQREAFRCDVVIVESCEQTYHIYPPDFKEFIRKATGKRKTSTKLSELGLVVSQDRIELIHDILVMKQTELMVSNPAPQILEDTVIHDSTEIQPVPEEEPAKVQLALFDF